MLVNLICNVCGKAILKAVVEPVEEGSNIYVTPCAYCIQNAWMRGLKDEGDMKRIIGMAREEVKEEMK